MWLCSTCIGCHGSFHLWSSDKSPRVGGGSALPIFLWWRACHWTPLGHGAYWVKIYNLKGHIESVFAHVSTCGILIWTWKLTKYIQIHTRIPGWGCASQRGTQCTITGLDHMKIWVRECEGFYQAFWDELVDFLWPVRGKKGQKQGILVAHTCLTMQYR